MRSSVTVIFARRMSLVLLCLAAALILSAVYVQPRVNAALAAVLEEGQTGDIKITTNPKEVFDSSEIGMMAGEIRDMGVRSGNIVISCSQEMAGIVSVRLTASIVLFSGKKVQTSEIKGFGPEYRQAMRNAYGGLLDFLKK